MASSKKCISYEMVYKAHVTSHKVFYWERFQTELSYKMYLQVHPGMLEITIPFFAINIF